MYFTDDSRLPENQGPLILTAAPYGPIWLPADHPEDIPVSWDAQVQKAVDCYNRVKGNGITRSADSLISEEK
jgi:hypothetical protein